jgi:phosphatidate phosphatase APP1
LLDFPKRKFILVGDSGEKDPEVYGKILSLYSKQIKAIFIRDVNNPNDTNNRYSKLFSKYKNIKWKLFKNAKELNKYKLFN